MFLSYHLTWSGVSIGDVKICLDAVTGHVARMCMCVGHTTPTGFAAQASSCA